MQRHATRLICVLALTVTAQLSSLAAAAPGGFGAPARLCATAIATAESEQAIPSQLLTAVALAESGRWDSTTQATVAWPWTVTAGGSGQFFPTKAAAIAAVRALQATGTRNIDVGCLQINLRYHPNAFPDLATAFEPAANAAYAARFLATLNRETLSWSQAVARYHSATPKYSRPYRARVIRLWNDARRAAAEAHRIRVREAYLARREARHQTGRGAPRDTADAS